MPCYRPLTAYYSRFPNPSGKRSLVFNQKDALSIPPIQISCGQCIGCRLERSRQWACRCVHEKQLHEFTSFITLTYSDEYLPFGGTLVREDLQKFWKRLRKKLKRKLLYFACGEYGDNNDRPHYHACLYGWDFPDKYQWTTENEHPLYRSPLLETLWPQGQSLIGELTFKSAAYVARYITKKVWGAAADKHYERISLETGEVFQILPEFSTMSLKPTIGKQWYEKYKDEVFPSDEVIINGRSVPPPRFYKKLLELSDPLLSETLSRKRLGAAKNNPDNKPDRLRTREIVKEAQASLLKRSLEN